jgi:hypothetical protein
MQDVTMAGPIALKKMNAGTLTSSNLQSIAQTGLQKWARPWSTLESFFSSVQVESIVPVRIDKDEQANYSAESYLLAQMQSLPWKLAQTEVYGGNRCTKGWFVVHAQWFSLRRISAVRVFS